MKEHKLNKEYLRISYISRIQARKKVYLNGEIQPVYTNKLLKWKKQLIFTIISRKYAKTTWYRDFSCPKDNNYWWFSH